MPLRFHIRLLPLRIALAVLWLALLPASPAHAQEAAKPDAAAQQAAEASWQPPDIVDLSSEWWSRLQGADGLLIPERVKRFLQAATERSAGLAGDDLVAARSDIDYLKSLFDLLLVAQKASADEALEPMVALDTYTLSDLLALRAKGRQYRAEQAELKLTIEQTENQYKLLQQERDDLARQYNAAAPSSPARMLIAIKRISSRVEFELASARADNLHQRLALVEQQIKSTDDQLTYARDHLAHDDVVLKDIQQAAEKAQAAVSTLTEKVAAFQPQLLEALSARPPNPGLEVLRKQQLTKAVAESSLSQLREAQTRAAANWYAFRYGELDPDFDFQASLSEARTLNEGALKQADVWAAASQTTLVSTPPTSDLNTVKNYELAQSAARDTLQLIGQIRAAADDLLLTQDILTTEGILAQSGWSNSLAKLALAMDRFWDSAVRLAEINLFDIGDTPVTPAGIFKMLFILGMSYGISWLIRHLLNRGIDREKVTRRAAVYALGRLLHYIIILVGVFAAMGSIGIDFTSFALIAGALSVGIGFGLQAIVNNFVSGLILLFEGTLRVGDFIQLDSGLTGVVREINTRATIVTTNDSVDVVVPNSELVTTKLTNWTLRESMGRIRVPFSVAYGSDKEVVKRVALEAVDDVEFALTHMSDREPQVRLVNFGDNALEFQTLMWLSRPGIRRPNRARGNYLWALETRLREAGIEIPFPQRDIHLRSDFRTPPASGETEGPEPA